VVLILDDESARAGVDLRLGTDVDSLDVERRLVRTDDGQQLAYDRLVLGVASAGGSA